MQRFHAPLQTLAAWLHRLTVLGCAGLLAVSLAAQLVTVILRYGFDTGFLWLQDLALWSFSALLMLAIPAALALDAHVRVDLFRERMSAAGRERLDRLSIPVLLFTLFGVLGWLTLPEAVEAWRIGEASPQIGGLPAFWIIRFVPVIAAVLALIQGAARLFGSNRNGDRT